MTMGIYLKVAFRNLLQARRRSLLLGLALGAVSMLLVFLLAISQGMTNSLLETTTTLASGHVNVHGFFKPSMNSGAWPIIEDAEKLRPIVEESLPDIETVVSRGHGWGKIVSDTGTIVTSVTGIVPEEEGRLRSRLSLAPRSAYVDGGGDEIVGDLSRVGERGTIYLFASQARRLKVDVGDTVILSAETSGGAVNSVDLTVVGIGRDLGMFTNFISFTHKDTIHEVYQHKHEASGSLMVYLEDIDRAQAARKELAEALEAKGLTVLENLEQPFYMRMEALSNERWAGQRYDVNTWEGEGAHGKWVITGFDGISFFLVSILVLIIVVGVMNTMWMSVRERTPEIGTLRAIGMKRSRVLVLFLTEALVLGLIASSVGAGVGALIAWGIDAAQLPLPSDAAKTVLMSDSLRLSVRPEQIVRAVLTFTFVSGAASLYPASRAARMRPVTAIHHVG